MAPFQAHEAVTASGVYTPCLLFRARVVDPAAILIRKERQLLTAWREAFRARFGLPTPANTLHACWTQTQLRAALLPAASSLPEPPADPEGVAKRARQALLRHDSCSPVPALTSTEQPLRSPL